jgi:hypothetical protein
MPTNNIVQLLYKGVAGSSRQAGRLGSLIEALEGRRSIVPYAAGIGRGAVGLGLSFQRRGQHGPAFTPGEITKNSIQHNSQKEKEAKRKTTTAILFPASAQAYNL